MEFAYWKLEETLLEIGKQRDVRILWNLKIGNRAIFKKTLIKREIQMKLQN